MRELAAATVLLLALAVGALAPKFWPVETESALASGRTPWVVEALRCFGP